MKNQFIKVPNKSQSEMYFLLTLSQNGDETRVGDKDVKSSKALQHLLHGRFRVPCLPHVCGKHQNFGARCGRDNRIPCLIEGVLIARY